MEKWRLIPGHPMYEVSNMGNIRYIKNGQLRNPTVNPNGYRYLSIADTTGKQKSYKVCHLVALCFIGDKPANCHVHHKDHIKTNDADTNIEYIHKLDHFNNEHGIFILSIEDVIDIRTRRAKGEKPRYILKDYPIGDRHLRKIVNMEKWKSL